MFILKASLVKTGEKGLSVVNSFFQCLAANLALCLSIFPYEFFFVLNNHLHPIGFKHSGLSTISHASLSLIDLSSANMASSHFSA